MHVHTNMEGHCNLSVLVLLAVPQNRVGYHEALTKLEPRWVSDVCAVLKIGSGVHGKGNVKSRVNKIRGGGTRELAREEIDIPEIDSKKMLN